jgi:hypothetical protein
MIVDNTLECLLLTSTRDGREPVSAAACAVTCGGIDANGTTPVTKYHMSIAAEKMSTASV